MEHTECTEQVYERHRHHKHRGHSIEIRNRVKELRMKCGMSQKQLADAVGLNHWTVRHIEHQDYTPSLGLASHLGYSSLKDLHASNESGPTRASESQVALFSKDDPEPLKISGNG